MKVSVIIPVVKNDPYIKKNLEALKRSTYKNIEIIVVDEGLERSAQRNIGMDRATGDCFLILDADQYVTPGLIAECVWKIRFYDALYIPEQITTKGFFAYLRNWERQFYNGTAVDAVRFFRKTNERFDLDQKGPEDSDLCRRMGPKRAVTNHHVEHEDNIGFFKYLSKKAYYSKSMKRFAQKNPNDKVLNFWWRCFGVYIENSKWKRLIQRPDLTVCLVGLVFLRGVVYLWNR